MFKQITFATAFLIPTLAVFAEEVKWPKPPNGYAAASSSIPKGTISPVLTYPSTGNGDLPVRVYTPPGYSATRAQKYPVLYLLHGQGGSEYAWTSTTPAGSNRYNEGNADKVMDYLYAQASLKVTPMIVVMPNGRSVPSGDNSKFAAFENILVKDLIPYIEKTYHASSDPSMRGLAGLSMGGGQTLNFGYKYPAIFNWIGSFSPAPNTTPAGTTITDLPAVKANIRLNFLAGGTVETMFLNTARTYHNWLNTNGVKNLYLQVEEGQDHVSENWNRQLHNFAQRIFTVDPTQVIRPVSRKASLSYAHTGEGQTASRFLVSRDGGAAGISIFSLDGRVVMERPAALLSGSTAQP
jgi:enterochelin esterase-like enzyme